MLIQLIREHPHSEEHLEYLDELEKRKKDVHSVQTVRKWCLHQMTINI